jgi:hypothetical protein
MIKITLTLISLFVMSCGSTVKNSEKTSDTSSESESKTNSEEMIAKGYKKGTVVFSDIEGDCTYTIQVEDSDSILLDPINMNERFKLNQEKIWFTYTPLKMMNRCEKANPVSLIDTQKRQE